MTTNDLIGAACAVAVGLVLLALAGCGNGAQYGQGGNIDVSGPDKFGVVCYSGGRGLSCVKVQEPVSK